MFPGGGGGVTNRRNFKWCRRLRWFENSHGKEVMFSCSAVFVVGAEEGSGGRSESRRAEFRPAEPHHSDPLGLSLLESQ